MQKLLFIGFTYHRKTGSSDFILDLFRRRYDVTTCWVDLYADDPYFSLDQVRGDYDILVCFQAMPPKSIVNNCFTYRHMAFFPMLDGCPGVAKPEKWYPYRDVQIICFSAELFRRLKAAGFSAHSIQYFPRPVAFEEWGDPLSAFFWARREEIHCDLVELLFSKTDLRKIHVHNSPDPGARPICKSEKKVMEYSFSAWFEDKAELESKMLESAFYIAPRTKEGIGMSFLEAMAAGRCVVATDAPTMNEYIKHGETGFLYDLKRPAPLQIDDVRTVQQQAYQFIEEGSARWEKEQSRIFDWMVAPVRISEGRIFFHMVVRFFKNPIKVIRVIKNEHFS